MNEGLIKIHNTCISKNLPFVTFRQPKHVHSTTYIQTTSGNVQWKSILDISSHTGFIMAPFDIRNGHQYILIKPDLVIDGNDISEEQIGHVEALKKRSQPVWPDGYPVVTGRDTYMKQVDTIKSSISTGAFQKAVLSRIRVIEGDYFTIIPRLFQTFCRRHPNAFVYLFKSDDHFWIGASPESLLRLIDGKMSTVSLAGTRPYAEKHMDVNRWTAKEVLEQEYVTRYIHDVLRTFHIRDYRVTSPYVQKAGNLVHLRTDFSFGFDKIAGRFWELVHAMHPTPAVAGQPKDDAVNFIKNLEPHDRDYYTGFLGPVSENDRIDLFVNLRCMQITPRYLSLFIGGGITLESDPADEWDETRWKAESLLKILRRYIKNLAPADELQSTYR
ncbi:MAG: chorismate-binding protein [Bacteroidales bacterium]|nr:chorismate-binding protein [Bacteroidales bacterium]